jgi:hypothetical protein
MWVQRRVLADEAKRIRQLVGEFVRMQRDKMVAVSIAVVTQ